MADTLRRICLANEQTVRRPVHSVVTQVGPPLTPSKAPLMPGWSYFLPAPCCDVFILSHTFSMMNTLPWPLGSDSFKTCAASLGLLFFLRVRNKWPQGRNSLESCQLLFFVASREEHRTSYSAQLQTDRLQVNPAH